MVPYAVVVILLFLNLAIDFTSKKTQTCLKKTDSRRTDRIALLVFHHVLSVFLLFGWLIPDRRVLTLFIVGNLLMLIEWMVFDGCRLTMWLNEMCDDDKFLPFRDVFWWSGVKDVAILRVGSVTLTLFHVLAVLFLFLGVMHLMHLRRL